VGREPGAHVIAAGFWLGFVVGLFAGASLGVLLAGLLAAAHRADELEPRPPGPPGNGDRRHG
jgi:hypothetical protein